MKWTDAFKLAQQYYLAHGNLLVPQGYISDGLNLYYWISNQRRRYAIGQKQNSTDEVADKEIQKELSQFDEIVAGEVHCPPDSSSVRSESCEQGDSASVHTDSCSQGMSANNSANKSVNKSTNRSPKPLTAEQIAALESIGMVWNANDFAWERAFAVAEAYHKEHGNLRVPLGYVRDGVDLNYWLRSQRQIRSGTQKNRKSAMTEEHVRRLDSIGMPWQPYDDAWEKSFAVAQKYYREHGNLIVPKHYEVDGVNLSHWIWAQRRIVNGTASETGRKLTEEQIRRLEDIGMVWVPKSKGFSYYYGLAKKFYDACGHTDFPEGEVTVAGEALPESGEALAAWKAQQEHGDFLEKKSGRAKEKRAMLREIGICMDQSLPPWERKYRAAEEYYREHGDLLVPFSYVTEDGIQLGKWISNQRVRRRGTWGTPPTEEQIQKLDAIGMSWDESRNRGKWNKPKSQLG